MLYILCVPLAQKLKNTIKFTGTQVKQKDDFFKTSSSTCAVVLENNIFKIIQRWRKDWGLTESHAERNWCHAETTDGVYEQSCWDTCHMMMRFSSSHVLWGIAAKLGHGLIYFDNFPNNFTLEHLDPFKYFVFFPTRC